MPTSTKAKRAPQKRSAVTRLTILDAAVCCLIEDGYAATSTLSIQDRAGVSRGRLLHHFPNKEELLLAALDHLFDVREAKGAETVEMSGSPTARIDSTLDWMWSSFHDPLWLAAVEIWTASRTNAYLAGTLAIRERELGARIRRMVATSMGPAVAEHPRFEAVVDLTISSMRGVALTYMFIPRDFQTDPHIQTWQRLFRELIAD